MGSLLLVAGVAVAGEPGKTPFSDPVAPFGGPVLSGRFVRAAGTTFERGGGTSAFSSGTFWEVSSKEARFIGLYFEGNGTLAWSAGDPAAARVFTGNAERIGGFQTGPEGALVSPFERALFTFSEAARPRLSLRGSRPAPPGGSCPDRIRES